MGKPLCSSSVQDNQDNQDTSEVCDASQIIMLECIPFSTHYVQIVGTCVYLILPDADSIRSN